MTTPLNNVCNFASLDGVQACVKDAWTYANAQYETGLQNFDKFVDEEMKNNQSAIFKMATLKTYVKDTFNGYWNSQTFQPYLSHGTAVVSGLSLAHGISRLKEKGIKDLRAWSEIGVGAGSFYLLESNPTANHTRVLQTFALSLFTAGVYFAPNSKTQAVPPAPNRFAMLRQKLIS